MRVETERQVPCTVTSVKDWVMARITSSFMGSESSEDTKLFPGEFLEKKQCSRGKHDDCSIEMGRGLRQHHPPERPGTEEGNNQSWKDLAEEDEKRPIIHPHGPIPRTRESAMEDTVLCSVQSFFSIFAGNLDKTPWEKEGNLQMTD